uniref:Uncharacterized protein n=1 Tax=Takifugu rubripes TaxID=31033 RepID=A0A674PDP5_TAKRU
VQRLLLPVKIVIIRYGVCAERVCAHVGVEGILHWETRPGDGAFGYLHGNVCLGEAGRIVVDIHHLYFHTKELQRVLQKHLQMQQARDGLLTDFFPVYLLFHDERAVLQIHFQIRCSGKFGNVQSQILCNIPNHGAWFLLLWHGVVELRDRECEWRGCFCAQLSSPPANSILKHRV